MQKQFNKLACNFLFFISELFCLHFVNNMLYVQTYDDRLL